jgi:hypothetical protein
LMMTAAALIHKPLLTYSFKTIEEANWPCKWCKNLSATPIQTENHFFSKQKLPRKIIFSKTTADALIPGNLNYQLWQHEMSLITLRVLIRATGWVGEKIAQNLAQSILCPN